MKKQTIYANALLSDGEILFWSTGQNKKGIYDFYKDFYYAGMNQTEYFKTHDMSVKTMEFSYEVEKEFDDEDRLYNYLIFNVLSKQFYKQWAISKDSKGEKAYE